MKRIKKYSIFIVVIFLIVAFKNFPIGNQSIPVAQIFKTAQIQYKEMLNVGQDLSKYPRTTAPDGSLKFVDINNWTGGFWPGNLWYMYEYTKNDFWKENAIKWTKSLEQNQYNTSHHDLGFMMFNSYGNAYRITKDSTLIPVLIQSANSLISRYSPAVGCIKSWNTKTSYNGKHIWKYPVIIDNMMNLELLFFASEQTKDPKYREIAIKHAETTMKNGIRPDFSSYHMINYDEKTGEVKDRKTVQGYSDNSQWARGQAWGVYGFTQVYYFTKDNKFLATAQKMADFYLDNPKLPADKIPFWDFNVGEKGYEPEWNYIPNKHQPTPRDASAGAIMSSALFMLSDYTTKPALKLKYRNAAELMLKSLSSSDYLAKPRTNNYFLLKHSVGYMEAHSEVDVPLIYADYYFLEALLRYNNLLKS
jgi:unsaturated chondroitin disaccharide hydrolase